MVSPGEAGVRTVGDDGALQERTGRVRAERLGISVDGEVSEALGFLRGFSVRNEGKRAELLGYLEKHAGEIIDYSRRKATGKWVGSGCREKAVDQVIGIRQKKKGMSWTKQGSRTLAQLKIAELNGQWEPLFAA